MLLGLIVCALVGGAAPAEPASPTSAPAVVLLPLMADGTVSAKQARGVSSQLRAA